MLQKAPWDLHLAPFGSLLEASWRQLGPKFAPIGPQLDPNLTSSWLILAPTGPILAPTRLSQSRFGTQVDQRCPQDSPEDLILHDFGSFLAHFEALWVALGMVWGHSRGKPSASNFASQR